MDNKERRSMRRFNLKLACLTAAPEQDRKMNDHWVTYNISVGGAYINAVHVWPVGTRLEIQLLLPRPKGLTGIKRGACVRLSGEVVRTDASGTALEFDDQYQITQMGKITDAGQMERQRHPPSSARGERYALSNSTMVNDNR